MAATSQLPAIFSSFSYSGKLQVKLYFIQVYFSIVPGLVYNLYIIENFIVSSYSLLNAWWVLSILKSTQHDVIKQLSLPQVSHYSNPTYSIAVCSV